MSGFPLVLGHRGAKACAPENTPRGFLRAIEDGADGVEFDVRCSRDRVPVLLHDATLLRTAHRAARLSQLDAAESRLPRLSAILDEFARVLYLNAEVKEPMPAAAWEVLAAKLPCPEGPGALVSSFSQRALREARLHAPSIPRGLLLGPADTLPQPALVDELGLSVLVLHDSLIHGPAVVESCRSLGTRLWCYVVNEPERARRLGEWGVEAVISDDPGMILRSRR
ncbi:MAG: glycerophosphodiester phosphodiesterase [Gemmatimonadota bacterium]|nr:glycerophosphodiester phosphodiesterase [Gemmatimonadota bacterium]